MDVESASYERSDKETFSRTPMLNVFGLPSISRTTGNIGKLVKSDIEGVVGHEEAINGRAGHLVFEGADTSLPY